MIRFEDYLKLVRTLTLKYSSFAYSLNVRLEPGDFIGAGWLGFRAALRNYDPTKGTKFITLAYRHICGQMQEVITRELVARRIPMAYKLRESIAIEEDPGLSIDVTAAIRRLPARERRVVKGMMSRRTQTEIGRSMGVTHQRINQIRDVAEGRLRRSLAAYESL